jgi:Ser/Thr protein kinase RdoA (MazF antagonist)
VSPTEIVAPPAADRDAELRGLRALAAAALARHGLAGAGLTLLEYKQNATFRVDGPAADERYLLRLCMPERYGEAALRSELQWLQSLRREAGLMVPEPVPARDGSLLPLVAAPGLAARSAALFRWLPGRPLEGSLTPELAERAGALLGRLHRHAAEFRPPRGFERPSWDLPRLVGEPQVLPGGWLPAGAEALLAPSDLALLEQAAQVVRAEIAPLGRGPESWGLIHTDLEPDNLILDGGELRPIDFEHCGWGWYLYDVAASLLPMADKPGFPALRAAFLRGYQVVRPAPPRLGELLDLFLVVRCLFSLRLILLEAWHHPVLREEATRLVPYMLAGLRRILRQRAAPAPAALSVVQLLGELRRLGVRPQLAGEALRFSAPRGALPAGLKAELARRKGEILDFLRQAGDAAGAAALPPIPRAPRDRPLPLSWAQQRLWWLDRLAPGTPAWNLPLVLRVEGRLEVARLARAMDEVVRRHEVLRTRFAPGPAGEPAQVVMPPRHRPVPVVDLGGLPDAAREAEARRLAEGDAMRSFDLAAGPLLRATLVTLGAAESVLLANLHHVVSDTASGAIFVREVGAIYQALSAPGPEAVSGPGSEAASGRASAAAALRPEPAAASRPASAAAARLPELPVQYADFAAWQRGRLHGERLAGEVAWWRERLRGAPALLALPADRPRPPLASPRGLGATVAVPRRLGEALAVLARQLGATPFMVLLAAFQVLLARHAGQTTVVVGSPVAGRRRPELEGLIGLFVNMLPLRADLAGDPPFRDLVTQVREGTLAALAHQEVPFEKLVLELGPQTGPDALRQPPIFQAAFALHDAPAPALRLPGFILRPVGMPRAPTPYDLSLALEPGADGLLGSLRARRDLFDAPSLQRLAVHFLVLLAAAADRPALRAWELPLLAGGERAQLLVEWSGTAGRLPAAPPASGVPARGGSRIYVLDPRLRPVPIGVAGDLHVAGIGPDPDSSGRPERTAARLLPDPFSPQPGARMLRTGTRARFRHDGEVELLGRPGPLTAEPGRLAAAAPPAANLDLEE